MTQLLYCSRKLSVDDTDTNISSLPRNLTTLRSDPSELIGPMQYPTA